jgi:hypothetical protein
MNLVWAKTATRTADIDEAALIETRTDVGCRRIMHGYQQQCPKDQNRELLLLGKTVPLQGSRAKYEGYPKPEAVAVTLNRFMGTGISLCRLILM